MPYVSDVAADNPYAVRDLNVSEEYDIER